MPAQMVNRAKASKTELKIPTLVEKGQHTDMFSNALHLMKFFLVGTAEENPEY